MKTKRNTLTAIIGKVQLLTYDAIGHPDFIERHARIRRAAVNEIKRLLEPKFQQAYSEGFDDGFTCAEIAYTSIITASEHYEEIEASNKPGIISEGLAAPGAGLSPINGDQILNDILDTLSKISGSGYEYVRR